MLDSEKAVEWSKNILKPGGFFYMDDYIGASRFQFSDEQLEIASNIRQAFYNTKYLIDPKETDVYLPSKMNRINENKLIELDPSEAADSGRIISAINKYFNNANIIYTGGVVYHLALNDIINNFDEQSDKHLLDILLIIDELCIKLNLTHYGICLAQKEMNSTQDMKN